MSPGRNHAPNLCNPPIPRLVSNVTVVFKPKGESVTQTEERSIELLRRDCLIFRPVTVVTWLHGCF